MLSPLAKGESGGCVFLGYPRFHEDKFTTSLPPFLRGILYKLKNRIPQSKIKLLSVED